MTSHHQHGNHSDHEHHHHEHHHDGDHHDERHCDPEKLSETHKLAKMMEHWVRHNEDHAKSFRDWSDRARAAGHEDVARILEDMAAGAGAQNAKLGEALKLLGKTP